MTVNQEQCRFYYVTLSFVVLVKVEDMKKQNGGQIVEYNVTIRCSKYNIDFLVKHKFLNISWFILCFQFNWLKH